MNENKSGIYTDHTNVDSGNTVPNSHKTSIKKAIHAFFEEAKKSNDGISARAWWKANPTIINGISEKKWLLGVLAEHDNEGKNGQWSLRLVESPDPIFDGNVLIKDAVVSKKKESN